MNKDHQVEDRTTIAQWIQGHDKQIYDLITTKYRNYVLTIINRYVIRSGFMNNTYLEIDIIFNEVIDFIYKVDVEKFLKWDFKTILSHAAIFTTSRYIRNYQTTKKKINLICGNLSESMFIVPHAPTAMLASDFPDTTAEFANQNVVESLLDATLNKHEKQDQLLYKTLYLKCSGYTNKEICEQLSVSRKFVYNLYQRWYKKNKPKITELLCLN